MYYHKLQSSIAKFIQQNSLVLREVLIKKNLSIEIDGLAQMRSVS